MITHSFVCQNVVWIKDILICQQIVATYFGALRATKRFPRQVYSRPISWWFMLPSSWGSNITIICLEYVASYILTWIRLGCKLKGEQEELFSSNFFILICLLAQHLHFILFMFCIHCIDTLNFVIMWTIICVCL